MSPESPQTLTEGLDYIRFSHEAMATSFELLIADQEPTYAAQAASACFTHLDQLEQQLSRFIANSDISQLNRTPVGQSVLVSVETLACLQKTQELYELTDGALDVTIGRMTAGKGPDTEDGRRRMQDRGTLVRGFGLRIDAAGMTVTRLHEWVQVDLGAVGKGFALDQLKNLLLEWHIRRALLHGGGSTVLALEAPLGHEGWPVTISHPLEPHLVLKNWYLRQRALSGSAQHDPPHIFNPRTGRPVTERLAAWALCPHATQADGLSTAAMILSPEAIKRICGQTQINILFIDDQGKFHQ